MGLGRRLSIISFTKKGKQLSEVMAEKLADADVSVFTKYRGNMDYGEGGDGNSICQVRFVESSAEQWARRQMEEGNALVFVGACGIAVRAIAPYVRDKLRDSPVLVADEGGRYVIPVLSGHMGGANEIARCLAGKLGAEAVITTATDINRKFAVDLFAKRNGLLIGDRREIVRVSSKALDGRSIAISIETGHREVGSWLPDGVHMIEYPPAGPADVVVTSKEGDFGKAMVLRPKEYVIGLGCRKGKDGTEIEAFILREMDRLGIWSGQIFALASIAQKCNEQGIVKWCRKEQVPFVTYTAGELKEVEGFFEGSAFVEKAVGVGNVCERAALKACGVGGRLVCGKRAENGMTLAIARREWMVKFDEQ